MTRDQIKIRISLLKRVSKKDKVRKNRSNTARVSNMASEFSRYHTINLLFG